jgi:N utilization substance protein A
MRLTVDEEELSKAIGRRGQNARLTSRLLGWDVQIEKDESAHQAFEARLQEAASLLASQLGIAEAGAMQLVQNGLVNLQGIAMVEAEDIADILGVSAEEAGALLEKAKGQFAAQGQGA